MATSRHIPRDSHEDILVRKALITTAVPQLMPQRGYTEEYEITPDGRRTVTVYESVEVRTITAHDHGDGTVVYTADVFVDVVDCQSPHESAPVRCMRGVTVTTQDDCFRRGSYNGWTSDATAVEDVELHPHFGL